jgi:hypothetical protein
MEYWKNFLSWVACAAIGLIVGLFVGAKHNLFSGRSTGADTITTTAVRVDAVRYPAPAAVDSTLVGQIVVKLPIQKHALKHSFGVRINEATSTQTPDTTKSYVDSSYHFREVTKKVSDTLSSDTVEADSVEVKIPITTKVYADSTYRLQVSGYEAKLDWIDTYSRTVTREKIIREKAKKWGVSLYAGYGIGKNWELTPSIGVALTYNLFSF